MGTPLILKDVRLSFPTLGKPEQYQNQGAFRWSAVLLVPAESIYKKQVDRALEDVAVAKWGAKAKTHLANILMDPKGCCWIDGARKAYEGYEGMFALSAHRRETEGRPEVRDNDLTPIYGPDGNFYPGKAGRIYGGCYVDAQVEFWAQENAQGKGLRATLLVLQRRRAGDSFGGGSTPTTEGFEAIEEGADADDLT